MTETDPNGAERNGFKNGLPETQPQVALDRELGERAQHPDTILTSNKSAGQQTVAGRGETILMVDDEEAVRKVGVTALEKQGYCVLQAANGEEALEVWNRHRACITVLVTDMVMPGDLNGWELAHQILDVQPMLRVVYTSGYSNELAKEVFDINRDIIFVQKPYLPEKLVATVRAALDFAQPPYNQDKQ